MAAGRYRYGPRVRELLLRLRAFGARHELLSAAVFFTVLACAWSWPMFKGDQLTQDYVLYRSVPWHAARPEGSPVTPRSTDGDVATQLYPLFRVARGQVRDGRLPLWDPYIYGGMTLVGDMQSAVLWPLTWLGWLLPAGFAWGLISTLKLAVAGFGAFLLARELGVRRGGCLVAGAVGCSGCGSEASSPGRWRRRPWRCRFSRRSGIPSPLRRMCRPGSTCRRGPRSSTRSPTCMGSTG